MADRAYADVLVVSVSGRLDHESADAFRAALQPRFAPWVEAGRPAVFELSGLEYVSSAGLRCFMLAAKQAEAAGSRVAVCGLRPLVEEIFDISRFTLVLAVHPSLREALAALSAEAATSYGGA